MDKVKILNVLQGEVVRRDKDYAIGFVTNYGVVTIRMNELPKFLAQNPHLAEVFKGSVIESKDIIGRYMWVKKRKVRCVLGNGVVETRIKVF